MYIFAIAKFHLHSFTYLNGKTKISTGFLSGFYIYVCSLIGCDEYNNNLSLVISFQRYLFK